MLGLPIVRNCADIRCRRKKSLLLRGPFQMQSASPLTQLTCSARGPLAPALGPSGTLPQPRLSQNHCTDERNGKLCEWACTAPRSCRRSAGSRWDHGRERTDPSKKAIGIPMKTKKQKQQRDSRQQRKLHYQQRHSTHLEKKLLREEGGHSKNTHENKKTTAKKTHHEKQTLRRILHCKGATTSTKRQRELFFSVQ